MAVEFWSGDGRNIVLKKYSCADYLLFKKCILIVERNVLLGRCNPFQAIEVGVINFSACKCSGI